MGIQQETSALEYSAEDANRIFQVNVTGVFMAAQAVAREMVRLRRGGSIVLVARMSGVVANKVRFVLFLFFSFSFFPFFLGVVSDMGWVMVWYGS